MLTKQIMKKNNIFPCQKGIKFVKHGNQLACQFYEKEGGVKMDETMIKIANKNYKTIAYKFVSL